MTSPCTSGSRRVESALEPTRSQNMMVSWRRSGVYADPAAAGATLSMSFPVLAVRLAPHSAQNFAAGGLAYPQLGQRRGNGVPHSWQNLAASGATPLQLGHSTPAPQ